MKYLLLLVVMVVGSSCLMLGAPHYYNYQSTRGNIDSVVVISYPSKLDYQYRFTENRWDSVMVFDPIQPGFKKMMLIENADFYPKAYYSYRSESRNLIKMRNIKSIFVKRYQQNIADVDTLYYKVVN